MDFALPSHLVPVVERVREFVRTRVVPLEPAFLKQGFRALEPELEKLRDEARAMGLFSPFVSKDHGGAGLSLGEYAHVAEELGWSLLGHYVFNAQAPDAGNMELLSEFATDEQKHRWLAPLVAGRIRSCWAMTEPDKAGSNPAWLDATARREGDEWVVDGHKWFTTGADGAAFAIVMAVTDPEASSPYLRASQILVPLDTPGYTLLRNLDVMGEEGDGWASHGEVRFDGCRVPVTNLVGPQGMGFALAQERLGPGRIHHCMRWIGICERAFDLMCRRAALRELAPGRVLGSRQMVQEWIADSRAEIDAARLMVLKAAWRIEHEGQKAARDEISVIKFYAANVLQRVLDRAIQAHGGLGLTDALPLAFWFRHERAARIYDGADEVHKQSLAKHILRRYGAQV